MVGDCNVGIPSNIYNLPGLKYISNVFFMQKNRIFHVSIDISFKPGYIATDWKIDTSVGIFTDPSPLQITHLDFPHSEITPKEWLLRGENDNLIQGFQNLTNQLFNSLSCLLLMEHYMTIVFQYSR